jgi:hypothetical protein
MSGDSDCSCSAHSNKKICYHSKIITFLSIAFASVATFVAWIFFFQLSMSSGFSSYFSINNEYFLKHPGTTLDSHALQSIGEMVANGSLLSLDDLWSFQGTFYQTIITVLIALNAILCGFAFFMVKQSSNAKAREEAILEVKNYIESKSFDREVKDITNNKVELTINQKIGDLQFDLTSQLEVISHLVDDVKDFEKKDSRVEALEIECAEMKKHISLLASIISKQDTSENDGSSLTLK